MPCFFRLARSLAVSHAKSIVEPRSPYTDIQYSPQGRRGQARSSQGGGRLRQSAYEPRALRSHPRGRPEQVLPLLLQRFEPLAREPGCRDYGARVAFVADLAQGVADEAQRVRGVERFVERVFHVEAKVDEFCRGALGRRQGFTGTLASRRHGATPANPA